MAEEINKGDSSASVAATDAPATNGGAETAGGTRIRSVARAARLLLWIAGQPHGASARDIATAQDLSLPTTYHLLNTLVDEGLLAKAGRAYVLGPSTPILVHAYLRSRSVPETLMAALRKVASITQETAYLADWGEYDIRVLASVEGSHRVRVAETDSGTYESGHARANGKVLLAYASPTVRQMYLNTHPMVRLTNHTICDPRQLETELEEIRERGYGFDEEEFEVGLSCVAAPVLRDDNIVAALGLTVPTERFKERRAELITALLDVTRALELAAGPAGDQGPTEAE